MYKNVEPAYILAEYFRVINCLFWVASVVLGEIENRLQYNWMVYLFDAWTWGASAMHWMACEVKISQRYDAPGESIVYTLFTMAVTHRAELSCVLAVLLAMGLASDIPFRLFRLLGNTLLNCLLAVIILVICDMGKHPRGEHPLQDLFEKEVYCEILGPWGVCMGSRD